MINKVKTKLKQVDYILHIADIHIRNWKRHKEFREVFKHLYEAVDNLPPNSIVTIGGDIVHAKTDMSPELFQMVSALFDTLASKVPTIVICGNHDTNLNNNTRLDALTPIVEASNNPNLFYLRNSGLYEIGDVAISVMSLLDPQSEYVTVDKIQQIDKYKQLIAMYHGTVVNSAVDSGLVITHGLDWSTFAGFDLALLGDIHKRQVLCKEAPLMFYPSSLVQQNFGESFEGHGYAIVDLTKPKQPSCSFHDIHNDYGFFTLDVKDGILPENLPISNKTSVRLKTTNTTPAQIKKILAEIRKKYRNSEVLVSNQDKIGGGDAIDLSDSIAGMDVRNAEYQATLIKNYLQQHHVDDETLSHILEINKNFNLKLPPSELARNIVWKPKKFEFSNMFSYGEDNVVDFEKLGGVCGLFAPNHTGKSAILDALCFCLFDHSFRAGKAEQVLNNKKDSFWCRLNFQLKGLDYFIEKRASRYTKGPLAGKLRVDIDFWYLTHDGEKKSLNGEQRRDTDKIIQSYVGSFDDFVLTALSLQGSNSNFIEKTQGERKDLLANFLDLKVFDQLAELANKDNKTAVVLLEEYQKQDFEQRLGDAERVCEAQTKTYQQTEQQHKQAQQELDQLNTALVSLTAELRPNEAQGLDLQQLQNKQQAVQQEITNKKQQIQKLEQELADSQQAAKRFMDAIEPTNAEELESQYRELLDKQKLQATLEHKLNQHKLTITTKLDKLKKLEEHKYDPNCSYCVANVFVKDAIRTKKELETDKVVVHDFLQEKKRIDEYVNNHNQVIQQYNQYVQAKSEHDKLINRCKLWVSNIKAANSQLQVLTGSCTKIQEQIDVFHRNEQTTNHNKNIQTQIDSCKTQIQAKKAEVDAISKKLQDLHAKIKVAEKVIEECNNSIEHMKQLSEKQIAYDYYLKAVGRDGVPYYLISKAVPYIQGYVNNILSQVVDFTIEIQTDGKNINVFIVYDDNKWPLELASGMEKFMSSLAIRVALIKITNLPKPDFIAIDEGLGVLDSSNLNSMHMFFNYLKDVFKFSLIISHIDVVRDMVDTILTIDRKNEFSHINHQ